MGTWEDPEECLNGVPLKHTSRDHCAGWGRLVRYPQPFFPYAGGGGPSDVTWAPSATPQG